MTKTSVLVFILAPLVVGCVSSPVAWRPDQREPAPGDSLSEDAAVYLPGDVIADGVHVTPGDAMVADIAELEAFFPSEVSPECVAVCEDKECGEDDGCGNLCLNDPSCDDEDPCTVDTCSLEGGCVHEPVNEEPCDDGDLCTENDQCAAGSCKGDALPDLACDDQNQCTLDTCEPAAGCVHTNVSGACEYADAPWVSGECLSGVCTPVSVKGVPCGEDDDCEGLGDGNPCTGVYICAAGICDFDESSISQCSQAGDTTCLKNICDPGDGECKPTPANDGLPCDDNDVCSLGDTCHEGECVAGEAVLACNDGNVCTADSCQSATGCVFSPVADSCDDGNACTTDDQCSGGWCLGSPLFCGDDNQCTTDGCDPESGCFHVPSDSICQDGNPCTAGDECVEGVCQGEVYSCDDGEECTADVCDGAGGCSHNPVEGECDDGIACTFGDHCDSGKCVGDLVGGCCLLDADCDDGNACTVDICDEVEHTCGHSGTGLDWLECELDGDGCTLDYCLGGVCQAGVGADCSAGVAPCEVGSCKSLGILEYECTTIAAPVGFSCEDGLFCTDGDQCDGDGSCLGGDPIDCGSLVGQCKLAVCDEDLDECVVAGNKAPGTLCNADDYGCTVGDKCSDGQCLPGPVADCSADDDDCKAGVCESDDPLTYSCVLVPKDPGTPCEDGLYCTEDDACDGNGLCSAGIPRDCSQYGSGCISATCDELSESCITEPAEDGNNCDDGDLCTMEDSCLNGVCVGKMDGCFERVLNTLTKQVSTLSNNGHQQAADLGFGDTVTVWRSGNAALTGQFLDAEMTKVGREMDLLATWDHDPWQCGPTVFKADAVALATGEWLVVAGYSYGQTTVLGCGWNSACHWEVWTSLVYAVFDKSGDQLSEWQSLGPVRKPHDYSSGMESCDNCNCTTLPVADNAFGDVSAVAFTDGSFGVVARLPGGDAFYSFITPSLDPGATLGLETIISPSACVLPNDTVALVYVADDEGERNAMLSLRGKDGAALGVPVLVSETESGKHTQPHCQAFSDGKVVVTFSTCHGAGECDAFVQVFKADGTPLGATLAANQATVGGQATTDSPLTFSNGAFAAVWHDENGDGAGWGVKARLFAKSLTPVGGEFPINKVTAGNQHWPSAVESNDEWLVLWAQELNDTSQDIRFRKFNKEGKPVAGAAERRANQNTEGSQSAPDAVGLDGGRLAIAWEAEGVDGSDTGVALRLFGLDLSPEGAEIQVNQWVPQMQEAPTVGFAAGAKTIAVAWTSFGQEEVEDVYARVFSSEGVPLTNEFRVNETTADSQFDPDLGMLADGRIVLAWTSYGSLQTGNDLRGRVFDSDGSPLTGELPLSATSEGNQGQASLVVVDGADPGFLVAWAGKGGVGDGIYVSRFDMDGQPSVAGDVLIDTFGPPDQPALARHVDGAVMVCWRAGAKLLCQRLDSNVTMIGPQIVVEAEGAPAHPALTFAGPNKMVLTYELSGLDAGGVAVRGVTMKPTGEQTRFPRLLNLREAGDQKTPFATVLGTGKVAVGWSGPLPEEDTSDDILFRVLK